jgi:transcriptional regulator with XRE-family HTH domain
VPRVRKANWQIAKRIGAKLAEVRIACGLTQVELAKRLGIPQPRLSAYERGQLRLYGEILFRIAQTLGVSADQLLGLSEPSQPRLVASRRMRRVLWQADHLSRRDRDALVRMLEGYLAGRKKRSAAPQGKADRA